MAWGDNMKGWFNADESGRALMWSVFGGFVGGAMAFVKVYQAAAAAPVPAPFLQFLIASFTGVVAAILGVVLVLNVDRRDWLRTFATGILCGFASQKIIDAAGDLLKKLFN
jgi:hypothetical protein